MLEGLDATEIKLSKLLERNDVFRIDAEYFGKLPMEVTARLDAHGAKPLCLMAFVTDGIHTSLPFIDDGEVKVLSAKHPKENLIDRSQFELISMAFHNANPRTALKENDVLISTVGTIGNSAVVTADLLPANSDRHIGIIRVNDESLSPYFLSTFLLTKYGRTQSRRETTGNVQPNLFISKIGQLLIPRFADSFESKVAATVIQAYRLREESSTWLEKAETTLLCALGLENWQAPESLSYVRNSRDAFAAGRLDAEFFSPKTNAIRAVIASKGDMALGEICTVSTGFPWRSDKFIARGTDEGEPFVRIRDCKPGAIRGNELDRLPANYAHSEEQPCANTGDIAVGMDGLKWFYASLLHDPCYINQRVAWLHSFDPSYPSAYLIVAINSLVGQSQLLSQMTIAQTVGHITLEDLRQLRIPVLTPETRNEISVNVKQSIASKQRATKLLDAAKRAVEITIEQNENVALDFLFKVASAESIQ